ncbi:NYN domain-containing protein [Proteiniclasticum sp. QWL-01]|uniref:NYN domain-containing protein n=1 Tax=Proteiniclasticum sp. QWL-01 TaxID=3036945 RepID=UPI00240FAE1C|nr:NYN domain-containing protein [Proteiniclasticum sp. QWL-01]WFF73026.1 NYN domain-containing protein [Proteiniclasticum sp. QWL-01]
MSEELTYALLIDAENISSKYIKIILDELSNDGVATYRRIYGDWTNPANSAWKDVLLNYSVNPVQQYSYTQGKNASDSAMIIDAMDILYSGNVEGFCLVSSDSDFTRLASRLRESGKRVIGMGESKTPSAFISACNQFKYLDILYASSYEEKEKEPRELVKETPVKSARRKPLVKAVKPPVNNGSKFPDAEKILPVLLEPVKPEPLKPEASKSVSVKAEPVRAEQTRPEPQTKLSTIRRSLRSIISEGSNEEGWISLSKIGNQLAKRFPDFDVRNYGYSKLNQFIESLGDFDMDVITPGKDSKVQHIYFRNKLKQK